jgi:hypothetical protein
VQAPQDGCQDEQGPEAAIQGLRRSDERRREPGVWDASGDAHQGGAADGAHLRRKRLDAAAEKSVDRAQDVPERGVRFRWDSLVPRVGPDAAAEPCRQAEVQFEERSCAARVAAARSRLAAQEDAVQALEVAEQLRRLQLEAQAELQAQVAQRQLVEAQALDVA